MNLGKALISSVGNLQLPTIAGQSYGGGYFAGRIKVSGVSYLLIVAPKEIGESVSLQWKTTQSSTANATSIWNGAANTSAMITAGASLHPAAQFCVNLNIGGYTDWALPARDQMELIYRNLKPDNTANSTTYGTNNSSDPIGANYTTTTPSQSVSLLFRAGGSQAFMTTGTYWSSTEISISNGLGHSFTDGNQINTTKTSYLNVRAVRMILV